MGNPSRTEIVIGRCAAFCAHPYAVWRTRSRKARAALVAAYAGAAYVGVLLALFLSR